VRAGLASCISVFCFYGRHCTCSCCNKCSGKPAVVPRVGGEGWQWPSSAVWCLHAPSVHAFRFPGADNLSLNDVLLLLKLLLHAMHCVRLRPRPAQRALDPGIAPGTAPTTWCIMPSSILVLLKASNHDALDQCTLHTHHVAPAVAGPQWPSHSSHAAVGRGSCVQLLLHTKWKRIKFNHKERTTPWWCAVVHS
jgi:hypothetical protein